MEKTFWNANLSMPLVARLPMYMKIDCWWKALFSRFLKSYSRFNDHCTINYDFSKAVVKISMEEQAILKLVAAFKSTQLTEKEGLLLAEFKQIIAKDLSIKSYHLLYSDSSGVNEEQVKV